MIDHLSASQLNLYLQCSLKYKLQYIDKLPKPFKSSGLVFGSCVHSAMSWLHKQRLAGKEVALEQMQRIFTADWYAGTPYTRHGFSDIIQSIWATQNTIIASVAM